MKKILILGDFYYSYSFISNDIKEISNYIKKNKYGVILNLESPLFNDEKEIKKRGPNLYQNKITIEILKELNVIGVCLANNHIMDFGKKALEKTMELLKNNNIKYCGAGKNIKDALKPMNFKFNNKEIYFFNYGWNIEETVYAKKNKSGAAPLKEKIIIKQIKQIKENNINSEVINLLHWGFEYNIYPMPKDINLAHKMIDNGSDLVIGHHPHNIQSYEEYKNKQIYYSLGNFYFSGRRKNFKNKKFNYKIKNMCDYGLGVILNIDTGKIEKEIVFFYNIEKDKTEIIENDKVKLNLMEDITNININKEYIKKIKYTSQNINPILKNNKSINILKIILLYIKYFIIKLKSKIFKIMRRKK